MLKKKTCIVAQTFRVIAHVVHINFLNMKEKEGVIGQIYAKRLFLS